MESSPRPGYYPDPSVPGYIRYWDGSKWVPGTSKPMPKKAGGVDVADSAPEAAGGPDAAAREAVAREAAGPETAAREAAGPETVAREAAAAEMAAREAAAARAPKAPAFAPPRPLSEVSFDDAKPSAATFPGRPSADFGEFTDFPSFSDIPATEPEPMPPSSFAASRSSFTTPRPLSETSFDEAMPEAPRAVPPPLPGFPGAPGQSQGSQMGNSSGMGSSAGMGNSAGIGSSSGMGNSSGMGISISGGPGFQAPPAQTPAQISAGSQSLRIRLLRPDGKPFDGPEITTGPKQSDEARGSSRTEFDTPRGPKKQAPKVVVKSGPLERAGHALAVLLISAIGIVPLAYLMLQSVHDREDKLAATISVPTKMNVLDSTSEAYLGGMVLVLLVVAVLYWMRLRRRRER